MKWLTNPYSNQDPIVGYLCPRSCGRIVDASTVVSIVPWGILGGDIRMEFYCECAQGEGAVAGIYQFVPEFLTRMFGGAVTLPYVNPMPQRPVSESHPLLQRFRFYLDELPWPGSKGPGGIVWPVTQYRE